MNVYLSTCAGRHAFRDKAGCEGGQAEGDQTGAAQLRKTKSENYLICSRDQLEHVATC